MSPLNIEAAKSIDHIMKMRPALALLPRAISGPTAIIRFKLSDSLQPEGVTNYWLQKEAGPNYINYSHVSFSKQGFAVIRIPGAAPGKSKQILVDFSRAGQ